MAIGMDQTTTEDTSNPDAESKSRKIWWILVIAMVVMAAFVYWLVAALGGDGDETGNATATFNTAQVIRTDLTDETTYEATLGRPEAEKLTASSDGTVTEVPESGTIVVSGESLFAVDNRPVVLLEGEVPAYRDLELGDVRVTLPAGANGIVTWLPNLGTILDSGSVIARINEVPVVILKGDVPMYRTLRSGVEGPDVEQLEQALVDLGYDSDGEVAIDEEFTNATKNMVERWQADLGVDETGSVDVGSVLFGPVPGQVVSWLVVVGSSVSPSTPVIEVSGGSSLSGPDILQLEQAISALGYDPGLADGIYDTSTALAVIEWTDVVGHGQDGRLPVGSVVFSPDGLRTADVLAPIGSVVGPSSPVITAAGLETIVRMDLPAQDQELLTVGSPVSIVMPDQSEVTGTVTFISTVATGGEPGSPATFDVEISLDDPSAAGELDEAPVDVKAVSEAVENVLAVPVSALLALAEGGYALELVESESTRLVAVDPGFFADGFVEVSGTITAGDIVVIP